MARAYGETAPTCSEIRRSGVPIAALSSCNYGLSAGISIERTQNATTAPRFPSRRERHAWGIPPAFAGSQQNWQRSSRLRERRRNVKAKENKREGRRGKKLRECRGFPRAESRHRHPASVVSAARKIASSSLARIIIARIMTGTLSKSPVNHHRFQHHCHCRCASTTTTITDGTRASDRGFPRPRRRDRFPATLPSTNAIAASVSLP
jgi:hypothetical protein